MENFEVRTTDEAWYGPRSVFTCPRCFALVLVPFERDHEAWHRNGLAGVEEANPA